MKFLEAKKILKERDGKRAVKLQLLASPQLENLSPYLEAYGVLAHQNIEIEHSQFGTLEQTLLLSPTKTNSVDTQDICVLFPWDFCRHLDWRSDAAPQVHELDTLLTELESFTALLAGFSGTVFYVDAPAPPVCKDSVQQSTLLNQIKSRVQQLNIHTLSDSVFNLDSYIEFGMPIHNSAAPAVAKRLIDGLEAYYKRNAPSKKVIVTDLDNVAWRGVIGEDGLNGIQCALHGKGKNQYLYQKYLKQQIGKGIILVAVSKNDQDLAKMPFKELELPIKVEDFVTIKASYGLKSTHIRELSLELNLPLDSFVFVDDNPVEIGEVSGELPQLTCLQFPLDTSLFPAFLNELDSYFSFSAGTAEDAKRSEMYKIRQQAIEESQSAHSLEDFLINLNMQMTIFDRTQSNAERPLQLINKTNQFNLNGQRISEAELANYIQQGARLFSASLTDKYGDHGEILACLMSHNGSILAWVMSCRVFQRRVEHCFLSWLFSHTKFSQMELCYKATDRNSPTGDFIGSLNETAIGNKNAVTLERVATEAKLNNPQQFFTVVESLT